MDVCFISVRHSYEKLTFCLPSAITPWRSDIKGSSFDMLCSSPRRTRGCPRLSRTTFPRKVLHFSYAGRNVHRGLQPKTILKAKLKMTTSCRNVVPGNRRYPRVRLDELYDISQYWNQIINRFCDIARNTLTLTLAN